MNKAFTTSLAEKLQQFDFQQISENHTNSITFLKQEHTHLYIVNLVPMQGMLNSDERKAWEQMYIQRIKKLSQQAPADRIMIIQLYITETKGDLYFQELCQYPFDPDQEMYFIPWLIDLEQKKLRIPPNQPKKILQIEKWIEQILDPQNTKETTKVMPLELKSTNLLLTLSLIAIHGLLWIWMERSGGSTDTKVLLQFGANEIGRILYYGEYWRLFTSMFLHIGVMHLLYNNFSLYLFGSRVEKYFGKMKFLIIYLFSGLVGSALSVLLAYYMGNLTNLSAGASGAIYGLLGATFALGRRTQRSIDQLSAYTIAIMIVVGLGMGFVYPNIDNMAHLAGLLTGYLLGRIL